MTYPDGIDALVNVNADQTLAAGGHAARHNSTNTALAEVRNFLASGSANTVLTAGSVVPTWDLVDPVSIANGSAGYVLTAGSAVPSWAPVAAGGKILQVVTATHATSVATTSSTFVTTNLTAIITPASTSNRVLIIAHVPAQNTANNGVGNFTIFRGTVSGTNLGNGNNGMAQIYSGAGDVHSTQAMVYIDLPSIASAQTYTVGMRSNNVSSTVRACVDNAMASIVLMEIAA
jgi:hypothetical protein